MHDIFISYAREDEEFAKILATTFEAEGWKVWWDRKIPTGKSFDKVIEEAIDGSKCVVVVWSDHSVESDWVSIEAGEGKSRNILVPVMISEVKIPLAFRRIQAAKMIGWSGDVEAEYYQILRNDIHKLFGQADKVKKVVAKPKKKVVKKKKKAATAPPKTAPVPAINLNGSWGHSQGYIHFSKTQGNAYHYKDMNFMNMEMGSGTAVVNGNQVTLNGMSYSVGQVQLNLTVNGNQMSGMVVTAFMSLPIALSRY